MTQDLSQAFDAIGLDLMGGASMIWLSLVGVVLIVWDIFSNNDTRIPWVAALALLAAMVLEVLRLNEASTTAFFELVRVGGVASFINVIILGSSLVTVLLSSSYLRQIKHAYGEVYALVLFATAGMLMLGTANNMVTVFVGLETMSIALYILTGLVRHDEGAIESAIKYFLLGAFSTGFFLFGIALIYGSTGTMYFSDMAAGYAASDLEALFWAGVALFLVGFMFKISAVPFHMWTPDVYQGAPTTLTGYMSTASKVAAIAALVLVLYNGIDQTTAQSDAGGNLQHVLALCSPGNRGAGQSVGADSEKRQAHAGLLIYCPCRLCVDWLGGGHFGCVFGGDVLPAHLCADESGCVRRDGAFGVGRP